MSESKTCQYLLPIGFNSSAEAYLKNKEMVKEIKKPRVRVVNETARAAVLAKLAIIDALPGFSNMTNI